jgi:hypothetical protein
VLGVAEGADGATVGRGVAGVSVGEGVGVAVGGGDGEAVGDERLAVVVPEAVVLGLAAGAAHAVTRARTRRATTGWRWNMSCHQTGRSTNPQGSTLGSPSTTAAGH